MKSLKQFFLMAIIAGFVSMTLLGIGAPTKPVPAEPEQRHKDYYYAYRMYQDSLYDLAAAEFLDFVDNNPGNANCSEALFLAGESLYRIGAYDRARATYLRCAIEYPLEKRVIDALSQVGTCWEAMKQPYQAAEGYYRVFMQAPNSDDAPSVLLKAGESYLKADSLNQARDRFESFLEHFPGRPESVDASITLAEITAQVGNVDSAVSIFPKLLITATVDSVKEKILWRWFMVEYRAHDQVAALKVGDRIITGFPKSARIPSVQRYLGELSLLADDAAEAEKRLTEALKAKGAPPEILWLRAIARWKKGNWDGALQDLAQDTTVAGKLLSGSCYREKGKADSARTVFVDCLRRNWGGPYGLKALEQLSALPTTLSTAECNQLPGLRALPDSVDRGLWVSYWLRVAPADKIFMDEDLVNSLIQEPKNPNADDILFSRGLWHRRRGEWEAAYQDFSSLTVRFPSSEWALDSHRMAEVLKNVAIPEPDRFEQMADILAKQSLSGAKVAPNEVAWCYFQQFKDYQKAEQWFQRTLGAAQIPADQSQEARLGAVLCKLYQLRLDTWTNQVPKALRPDSLMSVAFSLVEGSAANAKFRPLVEQSVAIFKEEFHKKTIPLEPFLKWMAVPGDSSYSMVRAASFRPMMTEYHLNLLSNDATGTHRRAALTLLSDGITKDSDSLEVRWAKWQKAELTAKDTSGNESMQMWQQLARSPGSFQVEGVLKLVDYLGTPSDRIPWLVLAREAAPYHGNYRDVCLRLGDQYFLSKRYEDALGVFSSIEEKETLTSDPFLRLTLTTDDLEYKLGAVYQAFGSNQKAAAHFRRYLTWHREGPTVQAALYGLGRSEEDIGFPEIALNYYRHIHRFFPNTDYDRMAMVRIGEIYWQREDYDSAAPVYQGLVTQQPKSEEAVNWEQRKIICFYRSGRMASADAARSQFDRSYKNGKNYAALDAELELESGKALVQAKNLKDGEKVLDRLAKRQSGQHISAEASYELGKMKLRSEKPEDGLELLTKIVTQNPKDSIVPEVYVTLGVYYYQSQQIENALEAFQNALTSVQGEPKILKDILNNLVVVYRDLGLWDAALGVLGRSLALFPEDDTVDRRLEQAQFLMRVGEVDRAVELLKKQLARATEADDLLAVQFYIGEAYFQKGMYAKAAAEYMKVKYYGVTSTLDWVVTGIYQAGQCYERMGKPDEAIALYREIIKREGRESPYARGAQARIDELEQRETLLKKEP
jgi:TolA-binding protein